jgi:pimeloyl-ACP methyl ester carboxylesterase
LLAGLEAPMLSTQPTSVGELHASEVQLAIGGRSLEGGPEACVGVVSVPGGDRQRVVDSRPERRREREGHGRLQHAHRLLNDVRAIFGQGGIREEEQGVEARAHLKRGIAGVEDRSEVRERLVEVPEQCRRHSTHEVMVVSSLHGVWTCDLAAVIEALDLHDATRASRHSRKSAKLIANATEIYYPGAPHGLTDTHAAKFNADLLAFLQSTDAPRSAAVRETIGAR